MNARTHTCPCAHAHACAHTYTHASFVAIAQRRHVCGAMQIKAKIPRRSVYIYVYIVEKQKQIYIYITTKPGPEDDAYLLLVLSF